MTFFFLPWFMVLSQQSEWIGWFLDLLPHFKIKHLDLLLDFRLNESSLCEWKQWNSSDEFIKIKTVCNKSSTEQHMALLHKNKSTLFELRLFSLVSRLRSFNPSTWNTMNSVIIQFTFKLLEQVKHLLITGALCTQP